MAIVTLDGLYATFITIVINEMRFIFGQKEPF